MFQYKLDFIVADVLDRLVSGFWWDCLRVIIYRINWSFYKAFFVRVVYCVPTECKNQMAPKINKQTKKIWVFRRSPWSCGGSRRQQHIVGFGVFMWLQQAAAAQQTAWRLLAQHAARRLITSGLCSTKPCQAPLIHSTTSSSSLLVIITNHLSPPSLAAHCLV